MTLDRDAIRRGMLALQDELGNEQAVAFLRAVADGALNGYLRQENPILSWMRRNPETLALGAVLLGTVGNAALVHFARRKRRTEVADREQVAAMVDTLRSTLEVSAGPTPSYPALPEPDDAD